MKEGLNKSSHQENTVGPLRNFIAKIRSRFAGRDSLQAPSTLEERELLIPITFQIINEDDPNNPYTQNPAVPYNHAELPRDWFSYSDFMIPTSTEGFNHNPDAHRHLGKVLAQTFSLGPKSKVLEFGCGTNYAVVEGLLDHGCRKIALLDYDAASDEAVKTIVAKPTDSGNRVHGDIPLYSGEFSQALEVGSVLAPQVGTFDFIMVNGGMFSAGNNFTAEHIGEAKYYELVQEQERSGPINFDKVGKYVNQYLREIAGVASELLNDGGVFYFSSSRYANHGSGYPAMRLHEERIRFLYMIDVLRSLGAKSFTIFGVSPEGIKANIEYNIGTEENMELLLRLVFKKLFVTGFDSPFALTTEENGKSRTLTRDELKKYAEDPEMFSNLISTPSIRQFLEEKASAIKGKLDSVVGALTCPIAEIPDDTEVFGMDSQMIRSIKANMADFPPEIARVDAVAAKF